MKFDFWVFVMAGLCFCFDLRPAEFFWDLQWIFVSLSCVGVCLNTFSFSEDSVEVEFLLAKIPGSEVGGLKSAFKSVKIGERFYSSSFSSSRIFPSLFWLVVSFI